MGDDVIVGQRVHQAQRVDVYFRAGAELLPARRVRVRCAFASDFGRGAVSPYLSAVCS